MHTNTVGHVQQIHSVYVSIIPLSPCLTFVLLNSLFPSFFVTLQWMTLPPCFCLILSHSFSLSLTIPFCLYLSPLIFLFCTITLSMSVSLSSVFLFFPFFWFWIMLSLSESQTRESLAPVCCAQRRRRDSSPTPMYFFNLPFSLSLPPAISLRSLLNSLSSIL